MKRIPLSEAQLLAVFFEETALHQAEQAEKLRNDSGPSARRTATDYGMETDSETGDIDEVDAFEAQRQARKQRR